MQYDTISEAFNVHLKTDTRAKATTSSAMAERPRDESAILRGWVTLRLNFKLKGYVSRHYLWTVR